MLESVTIPTITQSTVRLIAPDCPPERVVVWEASVPLPVTLTVALGVLTTVVPWVLTGCVIGPPVKEKPEHNEGSCHALLRHDTHWEISAFRLESLEVIQLYHIGIRLDKNKIEKNWGHWMHFDRTRWHVYKCRMDRLSYYNVESLSAPQLIKRHSETTSFWESAQLTYTFFTFEYHHS